MPILPLPPDALLDLRARVLRPGKPPEEARFPSDAAPGALHYGLEAEDGRLLACASAHPEAHPAPAELGAAPLRPYQLRGMAVEPEARGTGAGRALLAALEAAAAAAGADAMWCNARVSAQPFYEKQGYACTSAVFELIGIPHRRMIKRLAR